MVVRRVALSAVLVGSLAMLVCVIVDHPVAATLFALTATAFPPALIALGAARRSRLGRLAVPLLLLVLLLEGCVVAMLLLSGQGEIDARWLGLPPATAVMLYGLWLLPLLVVSLLFAWDFRRFGVDDRDLRRLRQLSRARRDRRAGD